MIPGADVADVRVPRALRRWAGDRELRPVWRNEAGGLTFEVVGVGAFVKWAPAGSRLRIAEEARRLAWAGRHLRVPAVLGSGRDEDGTWLVTSALPGRSAVDPRWLARPEVAVRVLGEGLRLLHESLPVAGCPFEWSVAGRVERARAGAVADGRADLLQRVAEFPGPPPHDRLVVCHGDPCCPNTLIGDDGELAGHVDLDCLGVADRWADLAVGSWSLEWNYGPGWDGAYFAAYGVEPDAERIAYHRALWSLGD
ncbi:aminoglycoside 3'-phosphotransferase [Kineococcus glutinatus]|uniref:Aminoglycoside 3'-phosphotransferase n=1 Tax=Kineococcus glutinatus TaxID=1070872 RepID=A0ABP9H894_9ACTN